MEELILSYLRSNKELLCEEYLYEKGIRVFEFQENGKTYFRVKMGKDNAYKNINISLQEILVFLFENHLSNRASIININNNPNML